MLSAHWTHPPQHHFPMETEAMGIDHHPQPPTCRKRKADSLPESNERLSKRLSLLNLEQGGTKLYVPVENPLITSTIPTLSSGSSSVPSTSFRNPQAENDSMQLDDSKHKVYIYDLEDELSSESEPEDGRLVFLPDIEKHLRKNRIPAHVLGNSDSDFAGKELVLYTIPSSISVPEEKDSVRKAIIEARARAREQQEAERKAIHSPGATSASNLPNPMHANPSTLMQQGSIHLNGYSQGPFAQPVPASNASSDSDVMDLD